MFIYNFKINGSAIFKFFLVVVIVIVLILCGVIGFKLYNASITVKDTIKIEDTTTLTNKNYSTILKAVHENIDEYVGLKIKFSGFVYRVYDLENDQFVLGRHMIISSDFQTVVVGFLCHDNEAIEFKDGAWVEIEGEITKGTYHNSEMPILEITSIKEIEKPNDEYVYPPDENYIPTSAMI